MNKGIWAIAIASAFIIGTLSANPVADAMAGWKFALDEHQSDDSAHHDVPEPQIVSRTNSMIFSPGGSGMFETVCEPGEFIFQLLDYSIDPPAARMPPSGVALGHVIDTTGRGNIGGDLEIGQTVTVTPDNNLVGDSTITLTIACIVSP